MRWPVFIMAAFVFIALQLSVRNVLTLYSVLGISPDLVAALAVFVAMFANRLHALWACWLLGFLMDLAPQAFELSYYVIGPRALGYVFGGFVVLNLRGMVFRRRALTVGFLTLVMLLSASVVMVFIMAARSWYPDAAPYQAMPDLGRNLLIAVYSAIVAIPVGAALNLTYSLWGFQSGLPRRSWG